VQRPEVRSEDKEEEIIQESGMIQRIQDKKCIRCAARFRPSADWQNHCSRECREADKAESMTPLECYELNLSELSGANSRNESQLLCHKWGLIAGLDKSQIIKDIRQHWGTGRQPTDRELNRAHKTAAIEAGKPYDSTAIPSRTKPKRAPEVQDEITRKVFDKLAGEPLTSNELAALSPIDVGRPGDGQRQRHNAELFLTTLFKPEEHVFCGPQDGPSKNVLPLEAWVEKLHSGDTQPQFIVNPLTGQWGDKVTESGKTKRGKNCIADLRFTLFEIDKIGGEKVPLELQARFLWRRITEGWPIRAIIYSGSKSLHAIVQVNESDLESWEENVKIGLFEAWGDMGADTSTWGPERQARLPGHKEKGRRMQSLLWLCPEGWTYSANDTQTQTNDCVESAPQTEVKPFYDPDGFTQDQRSKLNLMQSVFGGRNTEPRATSAL
jgi:hypothetical protein